MNDILDAIDAALAASPTADIAEAIGCFFLGCQHVNVLEALRSMKAAQEARGQVVVAFVVGNRFARQLQQEVGVPEGKDGITFCVATVDGVPVEYETDAVKAHTIACVHKTPWRPPAGAAN